MAEIVVLIEAETGGSGKSEKWGDSNREDTVSSCETLVILITALYNRSQSLLCVDEEKPLGNWPELEGLTSRRGARAIHTLLPTAANKQNFTVHLL